VRGGNSSSKKRIKGKKAPAARSETEQEKCVLRTGLKKDKKMGKRKAPKRAGNSKGIKKA